MYGKEEGKNKLRKEGREGRRKGERDKGRKESRGKNLVVSLEKRNVHKNY